MAIHVVRLGSTRERGEGLRIGTVRRPPRGIRREEVARRGFYDVWLPELAPSARLLTWAAAAPWTDRRWASFARRYRAEMRAPSARRLIALLAALSSHASFAVGCYCGDPSRCHRSILADLLRDAGAEIAAPRARRVRRTTRR